MSICGILWPSRRGNADLNGQAVFARYTNAIAAMQATVSSADDSKLLAQSWKIFDNESARRSSIDSRAGALMPAIGLAVTLVTGVGFTVLKDAGLPPIARWIILASYLLCLVYLVRTMLLVFVIQGEVYRNTADPTDLPTLDGDVVAPAPPVNGVTAPAPPSAYDRRLACVIMNYTIGNYRINNVQSDALFVAQKAFRNAIIVFVLGGVAAGMVIVGHTLAPAVAPYIIE